MIPIAAYIQKDLSAGKIVVAPIPNAMKSVMDVIVMATPACDIVRPSLSTTGLDLSLAKETLEDF